MCLSYTIDIYTPLVQSEPVQLAVQLQVFGAEHVPPFSQV